MKSNKNIIKLYMKLWITILVIAITAFHQTANANDDFNIGEIVSDHGKIDTNFTSYEPSYFEFITHHNKSDYANPGDVKYKFSVKYKIFTDHSAYFGYTQKSYWSLSRKSSPFRESNYSPEIFYKKNLKGEYMRGIQIGIWRHESTGEAEPNSKGWNTSYIEPFLCYNFYTTQCVKDPTQGGYLFLQPRLRVLALFGPAKELASDNEDILKYYGHFSIKVTYIHSQDWQLLVNTQIGDDYTKGGMEIKFDIAANKLALFPDDSTLKFSVNLWSGYGETLKNYNQYTEVVSIGFSAVI